MTNHKFTRIDPKHSQPRDQVLMRALETLHEPFSRNFGSALSTLLRSNVQVRLASVDPLSFGDFVSSLESPSCLNVLKIEPLEGKAVLDVKASIIFPIIDRLLGGGCEPSPPTRRPLTEIELRLARRIVNMFLDELRRAWESVLPLEPMVTRVESDPRRVQIVPPSAVMVVIRFELSIADARGMMNLCLPFDSIDRIRNKLAADASSSGQEQSTPENTEHFSRKGQSSLVEVVARLADIRISNKELIELGVGDIITTDKDFHSPLVVEIDGVARFHARPGALEGRKAIRIEGESIACVQGNEPIDCE